MFNDPIYYIFAGAAFIFLLIIIYFISQKSTSNTTDKMKKVQRSNKHSLKNTKTREILSEERYTQKEVTPKEAPQKEEKEEKKEASTLASLIEESSTEYLRGSEEGDFDQESKRSTPSTSSQQRLHKREVPRHGKITKHNFTEFSGQRVLVAEDNLINQKVLTGLLAGSGIDLVMADDGEEALNILENDDNFLMILMDAHMPRVDGFEATRIIRANPRYDHILIVALSGDTAVDDIRKMKEVGMAEQLEKPLKMEALYDILYAYTGMENSQKSANHKIVEIISTENIDGVKGLEVCGGDKDFYHEILDEFISDYAHSTKKIENLLRNGELEHADRVLLDIVGVTANIGAHPLHHIATEIKIALQKSGDKSYLNFIDEYNIRLNKLIKDIQDYR